MSGQKFPLISTTNIAENVSKPEKYLGPYKTSMELFGRNNLVVNHLRQKVPS